MGNSNGSPMPPVWLLGLALMGLVGTAHAQGQAPNFPDGPGKVETLQACGQCHGVAQVSVAKHTKQEWDNVVTDMIGRGAVIMENEIPVIAEYLAKSFPRTGNSVNINRADAQQLGLELKLTPQEAEALVRYREENGYFNKFADLGKVAGLDAKKLESAKDRLAY
jgi:competence protein ComEA